MGNKLIMASFRIALSMLAVLGCLRPATWTSSFKKFAYLVYSLIAYSFMQGIMMSTVVEALIDVRSHKDFSDLVIVLASVAGGICKMTMLLLSRKKIYTLINYLRREPFLPVDEEEVEIKNRLNKIIDMISIVFFGAIHVTLLLGWISTIILEGKNRKLPFRGWFPYNYSSLTIYALTFLFQFIAGSLDVTIHVACDTLISGMLIRIYGQLEILGHRLQKITVDQRKLVTKCAQHHHEIYVYAASVNKTFQEVLFFQMFVSMAMICISIFQLSQTRVPVKMIEKFMYMFCPIVQIFAYCWYGNEMKQKSLEISDMIFASNWTSLDKNTKRTLLMIMLRSTLPMEIKSGHIVSLNVDSFTSVIKTSYSAYNVLTQG